MVEAWWPVCSAVLRGAMRALDEPVDEGPSPEAVEIAQFVLRELAALRPNGGRAWVPPTPEGAPVYTAEGLQRSIGEDRDPR